MCHTREAQPQAILPLNISDLPLNPPLYLQNLEIILLLDTFYFSSWVGRVKKAKTWLYRKAVGIRERRSPKSQVSSLCTSHTEEFKTKQGYHKTVKEGRSQMKRSSKENGQNFVPVRDHK